MATTRKTYAQLRSARWFAPDDFRSSSHRSRALQMGYDHADWEGKPIIAIINTWSDLATCHSHFKQRVEEVKRGVLQAGGFPVELPALALPEVFVKPIIAIINTWSDLATCHSHFKQRVEEVKRGVLQAGGFPVELPALALPEVYVKPTTMLYRNLLALQTEELLRSHPVDGAVLMGGCDKTTPGLLMGALSMDLPAIYMPAGPMLRGNWRGETLGSGSDSFKFWDERRAGNINQTQWMEIEGGIARSAGTCMTMGTAATMMGITEALGLALPGSSSIPAVDANHQRMASACGRRIVEMVWEDQRPSTLLTRQHFENAIAVAMAEGCSTNAIIHLIAISRRAGSACTVTLDDFDAFSRKVPVLANIRPSGDKYLMEDFYYAGGMKGLMSRLRDAGLLHLDAITVSGLTVGENLQDAEVYHDDVIRPLDKAIYQEGALAVLRGNLAPNGCVIKPSACSPKFLKHCGPALVFDDYPSLKKAIDDPALDVTEDHVIILRNAGPQGGPGMPEWGMVPIPTKLVKQGVRDMLRISDARMSGTSYGACVLHVSPESYIGGPLALVRNGDLITVDVPARRIHLEVSDAELAARKAAWVTPPKRFERGYGHMFSQHILQADQGCDFDYLETSFGAPVAEPVIY